MPPKANLTKVANITTAAREIDFVTRFNKNWDSLREVMGIMRPIRKAPGTKLVSSTATVTLQDGDVAEGVEIPYSLATVEPVAFEDLNIRKWAKAVSIEAVEKHGAAVAVQKTDEAFLNELQGVVLGEFYDFIQTGTLAPEEEITDFQMGIAMAVGLVVDKFKKMRRDASRTTVWVNTLDAYRYLGAAALTVQNLFGIQYVKDFLGADTMIMSSEIEPGTILATPQDNVVLYYVDPGDSEFAQLGLDYTVQGETNLIGFHANGNYNTAVGESFAIMGMKLWAEYLDAIAVINVGGGTVNPSITLSQKTMSLAEGGTKALTATTVPADAVVTWASSDSTKATVSDGTVTAVAEGSANVTATITVDGTDYTATCAVTVTAE